MKSFVNNGSCLHRTRNDLADALDQLKAQIESSVNQEKLDENPKSPSTEKEGFTTQKSLYYMCYLN